MKKTLFIGLCFLPFAFTAQDINQGVVGHWLMDNEEVVIDQSDSGLDDVFSSYVLTEDRFGVEDEAHYFNGISDYVVFEDALDDITTIDDATFSISLWHRTDEVLPDLSPLICKYEHTGCGEARRQWALLISSADRVRFYYASTPDNLNFRGVSTTDLIAQEPNTWYHIVMTYDGSIDTNDGVDRVDIYVDNVLQPDTIFPETGLVGELGETINDGDAPIALMAYVDVDGDQCGDFNAPGALDDVRIYNRVVTAEEVGLLFEEGAVSIDEHGLSAALNVFPSIVSDGVLNLSSSMELSLDRLEILNTAGQVLMAEDASALLAAREINIQRLKPGSYLLRVTTNDGLTAVKRFMVQ